MRLLTAVQPFNRHTCCCSAWAASAGEREAPGTAATIPIMTSRQTTGFSDHDCVLTYLPKVLEKRLVVRLGRQLQDA
jgi:hypothetical protein